MEEVDMIPEDQLQVGSWYVGRGRGEAHIGLWTGEYFLFPAVTGIKHGSGPRDWTPTWVIKRGDHFNVPSGCFQPFRIIDVGVVGQAGESAEYATTLLFGCKEK